MTFTSAFQFNSPVFQWITAEQYIRHSAVNFKVFITGLLVCIPLVAGATSSLPAQGSDDRLLFNFESAATGRNSLSFISPLDSVSRDERSHASVSLHSEGKNSFLRFGYRLNPVRQTESGIRLSLSKLDASAYDHLLISVRGSADERFADALEVEFTRPEGCESEMIQTGSRIISGITDQWQQFSIPLNQMNGIVEWNCLEDLVISAHPRRTTVLQGSFDIDDIALIRTGSPGPHIHDPVPAPEKLAWKLARGNERNVRLALERRLTGWPEQLTRNNQELPKDDRAFLEQLARDTWRGIHDLSDLKHGLPLNNIVLEKPTLKAEDTRIGDYTNVTDIGLYLISIVAAHELGYIEQDAALDLIRTTLMTLQRLETYEGFYYNYYDTTSLERTSNFISFVDSSWLTAGLMVLRNAFPAVQQACTKLINQSNYRFFYDNVHQLMSHGYYVNLPGYSEYHYGLLYTESRLGSVIAIGKGDVPRTHWYQMLRTFPEYDTWQSSVPEDRRLKTVNEERVWGGYYSHGSDKFVPSWGGSLFEALMPTLVLDEQKFAPDSLGLNDIVHTRIHRKYALESRKYPVWGMSPSSRPPGDRYAEYGVPYLGTKGYSAGVVTPHVSALALNVTPEAAIDNLRNLAEFENLYGEYGLYDAVEPLTGQVSYSYIVLDQAMSLIALANYLTGNSIQKYFESDTISRNVLPMLAKEKFFD